MEATAHIPMNPRDYLILFALAEEARHGYGIVKDVEQGSRGAVLIDPANLYRSIKRMIAAGLVKEAAAPATVASTDSRRRYYDITPLGRQVLTLEASRLADLTAAAHARHLLPRGETA